MTQIIYLINTTKKTISNNSFKDVRKLLNERKGNLLRKGTNEIRKKLNGNEADYYYLKEKEQKCSLTNKEKKKIENIDKYVMNLKNSSDELQNINIILHMAQIIYPMNSVKKTILNQKK